ncbi:MAG: AraC family transcriptional regulator [Roseivirga sp.]|nr:AraC family transcriptional regulator [Roseivirga sp.]
MIYHRQLPAHALQSVINCYWYIDSQGDDSVDTQKIVPDGYPEIILHYGDPYEINLGDSWRGQSQYLLAGQIRQHFFLRNTGVSGMVGIKLQPATLTYLFGLDQSSLTGKVVELPESVGSVLSPVISLLGPDLDPAKIFHELDLAFSQFSVQGTQSNEITSALSILAERKGNIGVNELTTAVNCGERKLERLFKRFIGLSPKFYARIIRLSYIFELMQEGNKSWSDLVYDSGFYDQSHFIKNFKEFTGEDPSSYGFDERNMANFHLKK